MTKPLLALAAALLLAGCAGSDTRPTAGKPVAAGTPEIACSLDYSLSGWSILFKRAEGQGTVSCSNGQRAAVKIALVGGGLTAGKFRIDHGVGKVSHVHGIDEVFGSYVQLGAEAGVVKSGGAQLLTKGEVSLALAGHGEGVNLGISAGKFTITRQ